jgi:uncharacterized protein YdeI (YjbR/CyaY-like superfamily)
MDLHYSDTKFHDMAVINSQEMPVIAFSSQSEWEQWLELNNSLSNGVWLRFYKKASGVATVVYAEALDVALCFGWIDGQTKKFDQDSYLQKFTPRRARSIWSKKNIQNVARLESEGKMRPSGWKVVNDAKADGRWDGAYDSPGNMLIPEDLIEELSKDERDLAFFESMNRVNKYAISWRLQTAKNPEIRKKRMTAILAMIARGEKFHP